MLPLTSAREIVSNVPVSVSARPATASRTRWARLRRAQAPNVSGRWPGPDDGPSHSSRVRRSSSSERTSPRAKASLASSTAACSCSVFGSSSGARSRPTRADLPREPGARAGHRCPKGSGRARVAPRAHESSKSPLRGMLRTTCPRVYRHRHVDRVDPITWAWRHGWARGRSFRPRSRPGPSGRGAGHASTALLSVLFAHTLRQPHFRTAILTAKADERGTERLY